MMSAATCFSDLVIFSGTSAVAEKCFKDSNGHLFLSRFANKDFGTFRIGGKEERSKPSSYKTSLILSRSMEFM